MLESSLPGLKRIGRGKVRDIYEVGNDLLIVTTDRISAFDYILPVAIPRKGEVLNRISLFWFERFRALVPNHLITADVAAYPEELASFRSELAGRSVLVRRADMIPVECVARGYISGSGWKEYQAEGTICGIALPAGLKESDKLPEPIFTPATKADSGHDENVSFEYVASKIGVELTTRLRDLTLAIYTQASEYAATRGIIIADTKFEFGFLGSELILADEVLTPDSSRFWPADQWRPGGPQASYDKQFVRDYLESIRWNKQPPAPVLPDDVVRKTSEKYTEAYRLLTGTEL
ncbi:MAG: phosphoribosylaminoimidazolesuccinocarboxamide synthase [Bryobacteraceae bacterium]|nr:phosphoribosylaminoimidazolesuccinocarboxamide synthase [Bryobacteraceae bacterium]